MVSSSRVVGLDLGTTGVRAAELEFSTRRGGVRSGTVVRFGQVALPHGAVRDGEVVDSAVVTRVLKELWSKAKFGTKDVVIGVGNQRIVVRPLELPWMPADQIRTSLPFQVADLLPVNLDDALLDFHVTGEGEGPQGRTLHGMLVAAQRDTVTANVVAIEGAGLRPRMVDLNAFALLRALAHGEWAQRTVAFVDIGARLTNVVVAEAGQPVLVRIVPSGGQSVTDAVARAVGASQGDAERIKREVGFGFGVQAGQETAAQAVDEVCRALIDSVRNTFVYHTASQRGSAIEAVVLSGGGAQLPGLGQYLSSATRLPVVLGDPFGALRTAKGFDRSAIAGAESLAAMTLGLAQGVAA